jgi:5'-nucleotidase
LSPRAVTRLRSIDRRHLLPGLAAFTAALAVALLGIRAGAEPSGRVQLQLLGVNDFHGHLERAARLAGWLEHDSAQMPGRTIRVHDGDMVGASPLISSYFHDEPTIKAMNLMRFDVGALGNHEFDEGGRELMRLVRGGRRTDPAAFKSDAAGRLVNTSDPRFGGVRFPELAANTVDGRGRTLLPPYRVIERGGVKVGFIGVVTPTTPIYLLPSHAHEYRFLDISDTVNRWVPVLRRRGVEAIVVLAHSGATQDGPKASGEVIGEARQMSDAVDVVVAGHTHSPLNVRVPNRDGRGDKLVVQSWSYGVAYERVRLTIDRKSGDVVSKRARLQRTENEGVRADPRVAALVARYRRLVAPVARRVVARSRFELARPGQQGPGELSLGQLAVDAQRAAGHADFAFANHGETRADVPAGAITYANLFEAEAYEWPLVRMRLRGADVRRLLEQQWRDGATTPLDASGLHAEYDRSRPEGSRVVRITTASGRPLDDGRAYSVVANGLIAAGDRFPALRSGTERRRLGTDLQALVNWLGERGARRRLNSPGGRPSGARATESGAASPRSRAPEQSRRSR